VKNSLVALYFRMSSSSPISNVFRTFKENEAFLILCVQVAVLHIGQGLLAPILPLYAQTFAISATLVGFLLTSQSIPRVFVNLPAGQLADKWGAHRTLVLAASIVTVSAVSGGLAPNYPTLLLTRLLQGIGTGISQTSGFTYATAVSKPATRARFISLYQGSFLLGAGIGPTIGGIIAQYFGFRIPFFVYAGLATIVGFWIWIRLPDPRRISNQGVQRKQRPGFIVSLKSVLGVEGVLLASMIGLVGGYTRSAARNMAVPLQGSEIGLTEGQIGLALSGVFIAQFIALYLVGTLADRFGRKAVIIPSWLMVAMSIAGMALAPTFTFFTISTMLLGLTFGMGAPVPAVYIADAVDETMQGMAIGVFRTFNDAGAVLGPLVLGLIIDWADISTGLLFNSAFVTIIILAFWLKAPEMATHAEAVNK